MSRWGEKVGKNIGRWLIGQNQGWLTGGNLRYIG